MKILTVVGARPQFIKAAPVSAALAAHGHQEFLAHTGQHYDHRMSELFFEELGIREPDINLGTGSASHAVQTARMLAGLEPVLVAQQPDWVLVYGDTNSTLAAALAASKLELRLAHVEAGLRSFNCEMPEEHNRVLTDACAHLLLCPTEAAVKNLRDEGREEGVVRVGDTMCDLLLSVRDHAAATTIVDDLDLEAGGYAIATVHRAYNTDPPGALAEILAALGRISEPVVVPLHPRTRARLEADGGSGIDVPANVRLLEPVGYLEMIALQADARVVLTDSGGMQKEAYLLGVPCITLRPETEWIETVEAGWNVVVGRDSDLIVSAASRTDWPSSPAPPVYGDGDAAERIVDALETA